MIDNIMMSLRYPARVLLLGFVFHIWMSSSLVFAEDADVAKVVASVAIGGDTSSAGSDTALPDLFTGAMSYQIPIEVPPGRNGMDPGLALRYSSRGGNSWVGMGWDLEVGSIERSTRAGVDYTKENFVLRRAGSISELVKVSDGEYRSKIESDFMRIQQQSDGSFVATNKVGIKFYFGEPGLTNSTISGPPGTFKWALDRIVDTSLNEIKFTYQSFNDGQIYLDHIDYNGNLIKFYLEDRPDVSDMHTYQFQIKTAKRLKLIDVKGADGSRIRTYKFTYKQGSNTNRSLLLEVAQFGNNADIDSSNGTINNEASLTGLKLFNSPDYGDVDDNSFATTTNPGGIGSTGWSIGNTIQLVGDFNGDGKTDILKLQTDGSNQLLLSNGDGTFTSLVPSDSNGAPYSGWYAGSPTVLAGDFTADGKADLLIMKPDGTNNIYSYSGADGKFTVQAAPLGSTATWTEPATKLIGDFNGDGKLDVLVWQSNGVAKAFLSGVGYSLKSLTLGAWTYAQHLVGNFVNNGRTSILMLQSSGVNRLLVTDNNGNFETKYFNVDGVIDASGGWGDSNIKVVTGDFNGDGITDILKTDKNSSNSDLYTSNANGTFTKTTVTGLGKTSSGNIFGTNFYVGDFNGDGKSDVLKITYTFGPILRIVPQRLFQNSTIYLSNADATFTVKDYGNAPNCSLTFANEFTDVINKSAILLSDYTGNGKTGIINWSSLGSKFGNYLYSKVYDEPLDMLRSFKNHTGGTIAIDYTASTKLTTANQIPFPLWVVKSITTNDGNGNSAQTLFDYSGGYYYAPERDFRGFNRVTVTGPVGAGGERKITETWFHQGNYVGIDANDPNVSVGYMKGKPYRVRVTDGVGNIYSETETAYTAQRPATPPSAWYFNPPAEVHTYICDGNAIGQCKGSTAAKHYWTEYQYDSEQGATEYGNLTYEKRHGDDADTNDDLTIYRNYSPNATNWIVGLPTSELIYKGIGTSGTKMSETNYYYDGLNTCTTASTNQVPDKGRLTRIKRWVHYDGEADSYIEERMGYDDSTGNLLCRREPKGYVTSIGYDPSNTFPVTTTNQLGQQFVTEYYGVNGLTADKGRYGQVKSVADPNGAKTTREYDAFGRLLKETRADATWTSWDYKIDGIIGSQRVRLDTSDGLWTENYFDGLGRTYWSKAKGPESKIIETKTVYDARGTVSKNSLPYIGTETQRNILTDYDPIGRVVRAGQESPADYIRSLTCYKNDVTEKIDPNNHRRREERDSSGRLTKVQEYTGTTSSCSSAGTTTLYATTTYQYDVLGNLLLVTDANANKTEMKYDSLGRKRYMRDPDMGEWRYTYDANGNLETQTDAKGQVITFTYDELNRLKTKKYGTTVVLTNTYDEVAAGYFNKGRLTKMTDLSGQTVYKYDNMGRVKSSAKTIDGLIYNLGFSYLNGRLDTITYPDNEIVSYSYDAGYLKGVTGYIGYSDFDAIGRPWTAKYGAAGASSKYTFDPVTKRLSSLSVVTPSQVLLVNNSSYGYDNKGNITSITDGLNKTPPTNFSSESYIPRTGSAHLVGSTGSGRAFIPDANGNIVNDGLRTIAYNYDNMPTSVNSTNFSYDGNSTRVKKSSPGKTTIYIDKFYECTSGICTKYIFAGDTRVAKKVGIETMYYHPDHQGSTSVVTNAAGNKVDDIAYFPFGEKRQSGSSSVSHMYTGQELDSETGLYNYNARLYDPDLGRFLTPDSIVQAPGDPQAFNRYAYARNNPVLYTDPTGHWFGLDDLIATVVGAVVGGVSAAIQGGDVWQGMAVGAVAGWVGYNTFGTASAAVECVTGSSFAGGVVGGAAGGAAAGATSSAMNGTNVGEGAGFGAMYGAVSGGIKSYWGNKWDMWRVGATTLAGGGLSAAEGGDWKTGALFAFGFSTAAYAYNSAVRYGTVWNPGGDAVNKKWDTYPVEGANNIGTQGGPVDPDGWFNEGGRVSRFANYIPGVNAVSGLHDVFQVTLDRWGGDWARNILNVPGMIPAAGITYGALMTDMQAVYSTMSARGRTR